MSTTTSVSDGISALRGSACGRAPLAAGGHDRRKGGTVGSGVLHGALDVERDLALGPARQPAGANVLVCAIGDLGGGSHGRHLVPILYRPQLFHETAGGHQLHPLPGLLGEPRVGANARVRVVEPAPPADAAGQLGDQVAAGLHALEAVHLRARPARRSGSR